MLFVIKTMTPHLVAIHSLRAEAEEFATKAEMMGVDMPRDSWLDMNAIPLKTLTYSKAEPTLAGELNV